MIAKVPVSSSKLAALTGKPWFWAAVVGLLFAAPLARGLSQGGRVSPPPVLGAFPSFALVADDGTALRASDLRGHAFIADLLCAACPARIAAMGTLQHRTRNLGDAVRLLSFSQGLDAAALREVRSRHRAGQRWMLLAGAPDGALPLFDGANAAVLVDGQSRIRGRYDLQRTEDVDHLLRDAALVAEIP